MEEKSKECVDPDLDPVPDPDNGGDAEHSQIRSLDLCTQCTPIKRVWT